jgi:hypothetical protein
VTTQPAKNWPASCAWFVELNGQWQYCGLPIAGKSTYGDGAPLCRKHLTGEHAAVIGKAGR